LFVAAVQAFSRGSKPLAFTTTVPESAGTWSNANAPEESVVVEAEYDPACSSTWAVAMEAPLESRTAPSTRNCWARTSGAMAKRSAIANSARRQIRSRRSGEGGVREIASLARLDMNSRAIFADSIGFECWASIKGEVREEFKRLLSAGCWPSH